MSSTCQQEYKYKRKTDKERQVFVSWIKKEFFFTYFKIVLLLLEFETGIGSGNVLEKRWRVFADDGLCVVAANVVPLDAILVDVVEDAKAGLGCLVDFKLGVVWLRFLKVTSGAPGLISPAGRFLIGASEFDTRARPEPAIDNERLKIFSVASLEVAQTTARPNVRQFLCALERNKTKKLDEYNFDLKNVFFFFTLFENAEDHVVLFDSLNANGVHAVLTA